ncbi:hypothetical protein [Mesorhizobium caraganae]|uniref:hypothetical protein n=1 Tax=Mesorhizobium caraganae TaxID=483206 RepID=UPI003ECD9C87
MTERTTIAESLPATAVVRVSRASFDPSRFAEVEAASKKTAQYIIPAIRQLPGLLHFYAGASPKGSIVQVSVWDTDEHAAQLDHLKEMVVRRPPGYGSSRRDIHPDSQPPDRLDLDRLTRAIPGKRFSVRNCVKTKR